MSIQTTAEETFLDAIRRSLRTQGNTPAFTFLPDGEADAAETISFAELDRAAQSVAADLQAKGVRRGDRVMLLQAPGKGVVVGFLGCVYAGAIAVPGYPP